MTLPTKCATAGLSVAMVQEEQHSEKTQLEALDVPRELCGSGLWH
jgi:hypothetical protein